MIKASEAIKLTEQAERNYVDTLLITLEEEIEQAIKKAANNRQWWCSIKLGPLEIGIVHKIKEKLDTQLQLEGYGVEFRNVPNENIDENPFTMDEPVIIEINWGELKE